MDNRKWQMMKDSERLEKVPLRMITKNENANKWQDIIAEENNKNPFGKSSEYLNKIIIIQSCNDTSDIIITFDHICGDAKATQEVSRLFIEYYADLSKQDSDLSNPLAMFEAEGQIPPTSLDLFPFGDQSKPEGPISTLPVLPTKWDNHYIQIADRELRQFYREIPEDKMKLIHSIGKKRGLTVNSVLCAAFNDACHFEQKGWWELTPEDK